MEFAYEEEDVFNKSFFSCSMFCLAQLKTKLQHYRGISPLRCHFFLNRAWFAKATTAFHYY